MRRFGDSRRKGKVVGQEDDDDDDQGSAVKRPAAKSRLSSRTAAVSGATEKPSRRLATSIRIDSLPRTADTRQSYSADDLAQLKNATPSIPAGPPDEAAKHEIRALDIAAKFGTDVTVARDAARTAIIPTDAEIQEKKSRRARLAKELKYKSKTSDSSDEDDGGAKAQDVDSGDDEFRNQHDRIALSESKPSKYAETRLVRDEEDFMEDLDGYVDSGRIEVGSRAQRAQENRQREQVREMIADAEGSSNQEDSDDSDKQRREAYETTQTRKGMAGLRVDDSARDHRPRTPPKISTLPSLSGCLERLRNEMLTLENARKENLAQLEHIQRERTDIKAREGEIQGLLEEAGKRYESLRSEALSENKAPNGLDASLMPQRGLETLGNASSAAPAGPPA